MCVEVKPMCVKEVKKWFVEVTEAKKASVHEVQ